jgi:hypothetical protein
MDTEKYIGKYVGPNKIVEANEADEKTYLGNPKLKLVFEDNQAMLLPLDAVEAAATPEKSDLTNLREARVKPVVEKLLTVLVEAELSSDDLNYAIGPKLTESLNAVFQRAQAILWGKERHEITLYDVDKVLKKVNQK